MGGVAKLLRNINRHKTVEPDNISARLIKETAAELAPVLSLIFQASFQQSALLDDWKEAFVSLIFTKGDRSKPANHRLVSLTCICCKLIENIITSSVMSHHIDHHNILTEAKHGFRKQRSCESQLILTVRDLAQGIEEKSQLDVILLDFTHITTT